jgi:hypothetical protein
MRTQIDIGILGYCGIRQAVPRTYSYLTGHYL